MDYLKFRIRRNKYEYGYITACQHQMNIPNARRERSIKHQQLANINMQGHDVKVTKQTPRSATTYFSSNKLPSFVQCFSIFPVGSMLELFARNFLLYNGNEHNPVLHSLKIKSWKLFLCKGGETPDG